MAVSVAWILDASGRVPWRLSLPDRPFQARLAGQLLPSSPQLRIVFTFHELVAVPRATGHSPELLLDGPKGITGLGGLSSLAYERVSSEKSMPLWAKQDGQGSLLNPGCIMMRRGWFFFVSAYVLHCYYAMPVLLGGLAM